MNFDHEKSHAKLNFMANIIVGLLTVLTALSVVIFYQKTFYGNGWIEYMNVPFPTDSKEYSVGEVVSYHAVITRKTSVEKKCHEQFKPHVATFMICP